MCVGYCGSFPLLFSAVDKEIEAGRAPLAGKELLWIDDAIDVFFLHVQGSGRVRLENGETVRVGYADQNGLAGCLVPSYCVDEWNDSPAS